MCPMSPCKCLDLAIAWAGGKVPIVYWTVLSNLTVSSDLRAPAQPVSNRPLAGRRAASKKPAKTGPAARALANAAANGVGVCQIMAWSPKIQLFYPTISYNIYVHIYVMICYL